jgi:hypothetical protein
VAERVSLRDAWLQPTPGASATTTTARITSIATTFITGILGTASGPLSIDIGKVIKSNVALERKTKPLNGNRFQLERSR